MKFVADESLESEIFLAPRATGHEVCSIREESPGIDDETVLARANQQGAILISNDKDFGELVFRSGWAHHGIILLRLGEIAIAAKIEILNAVIQEAGSKLANSFTVLSPGQIRIHPSDNS